MREKPFSLKDREELARDVDEDKALPDMYFKRLIFESHDRMIKAESLMSFNRFKNGGVYNILDVYRFRSSILDLFRRISGMISHNEIFNLPPELGNKYVHSKYSDFDICLHLVNGESITENELVRCSAFLGYCLHRLNLTNLLQGYEERGDEEDFKNY